MPNKRRSHKRIEGRNLLRQHCVDICTYIIKLATGQHNWKFRIGFKPHLVIQNQVVAIDFHRNGMLLGILLLVIAVSLVQSGEVFPFRRQRTQFFARAPSVQLFQTVNHVVIAGV